jgi:hypothetical protein
MNRKPLPGYDNRGLVPDPDRLAEAHHVRRDPVTDEISWPPSRMADMLRELKLIEDRDHEP